MKGEHSAMPDAAVAHYHLPGLFEFYDFYRAFLPLYRRHREYFYDWCDIASLYGAPEGCLWGGGRIGSGNCDPRDVLALTREYGISARLTFSNSLLRPEHLADRGCNRLCRLFAGSAGPQNGVIVHSELLLEHLRSVYPELYLVSSTTKVLTDFAALRQELERPEFRCVVPDFRLNRAFDRLDTLPQALRDKVEFLCNECCDFGWSGGPAMRPSAGKIWERAVRSTAAHPRTPPEAIAFPGPWRIPASSGWTTSGARICPWAFPNSRSRAGAWAALCCWSFCCTI